MGLESRERRERCRVRGGRTTHLSCDTVEETVSADEDRSGRAGYQDVGGERESSGGERPTDGVSVRSYTSSGPVEEETKASVSLSWSTGEDTRVRRRS